MKKYFLCLLTLCWVAAGGSAAQLCHDFDADMNLITVDCMTGKRIITAEDKARVAQAKQEAADKQRRAAEKTRQTRIRQAEAEQKKIEKAIEKRKKELAQQRQKQAQQPKRVQIDGKTYYLTEQAHSGNGSAIRAGEWMLSVYGGAGTYLSGKVQTGQTQINAKQVVLWSGGLSGMYFLNPYLGIGLGLETDQAPKSDRQGKTSYGGFPYYGESESKVSLYKAMLQGRLNVNPAHPVRLYVPFGIGYGYVQDKQTHTKYVYNGMYTSAVNNNATHTDSTLVYFAGLGLEFDLTATVSLGVEGRYNRFGYAHETFAYVNGLAKVNIKF